MLLLLVPAIGLAAAAAWLSSAAIALALVSMPLASAAFASGVEATSPGRLVRGLLTATIVWALYYLLSVLLIGSVHWAVEGSEIIALRALPILGVLILASIIYKLSNLSVLPLTHSSAPGFMDALSESSNHTHSQAFWLTLIHILLLSIPLVHTYAPDALGLPGWLSFAFLMMPVGCFLLVALQQTETGLDAEMSHTGLSKKQRRLIGAVRERNTLVAYELLEHGVNPQLNDPEAETPLLIAVQNDDVGMVRALLRAGADATASSQDQLPLLHAIRNASQSGREIAQLLLDNGAEVNAHADGGTTPLHTAAFRGDWKAIQMLISAGSGLEMVNEQKQTPLAVCCANARWRAAELLIEKGANLNPASGEPPIYLASNLQEDDPTGVSMLLSHGADPNTSTRLGRTCLMAAALQGNASIVEMLLKEGAQLNARDNFGSTALMEAARAGANLVLQRLASWHPETEHADKLQRTALILAATSKRSDAETIRLLLQMGADRNAVNKDGLTAEAICKAQKRQRLLSAFQEPPNDNKRKVPDSGSGDNDDDEFETDTIDLTTFEALDPDTPKNGEELEAPAVTGTNDEQDTPELKDTAPPNLDLPFAEPADESPSAVQEASPEQPEDEVVSVASQQVEKPEPEDEDHSGPQTPDPADLLVEAAGDGELEVCESILATHTDMPEWVLQSAFNLALKNRHGDIACLLLENGLPADARNDANQSILLQLIAEPDPMLSVCNLLIQRGADVNDEDDEAAILHYACGCRTSEHVEARTEIVKLLLKSGARVDILDSLGRTPLHWGVLTLQANAVKALLDAGADANAKDHQGDTPLLLICAAKRDNSPSIVRHLVKAGADIKITNKQKQSAIQIAIESGDETLKQFLLMGQKSSIPSTPKTPPETDKTTHEPEAKPAPPPRKSPPPKAASGVSGQDQPKPQNLCEAAANGDVQSIQEMLDQDVDIDATDQHGCTPLIRAAGAGNLDAVDMLLKSGADHSISTPGGFTPLLAAVSAGFPEVVRKLANRGANIEHQQEYGLTPLMLAAARFHTDVVALLIELGSDVDGRDDADNTALMAAVQNALLSADQQRGNEVINLLINAGANINALNDDGQSALMLLMGIRARDGIQMADDQVAEIAELLIKAGAGVDQQDFSGWTALHAAASQGFSNSVRLLLKAGAKPRITDINGLRAADLAMDYGYDDIARMLDHR